MDRETIGKKVLEHLAIQGELEGVKREQVEQEDQISSNERETKRLESLKAETTKLKEQRIASGKKQDNLEKELNTLDKELKEANAVVPFVSSVDAPTHIKL